LLCAFSSTYYPFLHSHPVQARSGKDINLNVMQIYGYRTFCNKIWNAIRLVMKQIGTEYKPNPAAIAAEITDRWIMSRLAYAVAEANASLKAYDFVAATTAIYNLWLYEFCGVYLEYSKIAVKVRQNYPHVSVHIPASCFSACACHKRRMEFRHVSLQSS